MKLLVKFSLIFALVFGVGLYIAGRVCEGFLQQTAEAQVIDQAHLMMEAAMSMRTYTTKQIKPLIAEVHHRDQVFFAQTVPAYAATESFNYLRVAYPEYSYREATLNPTNPRDRAQEWEADIVNVFRNDPKRKDVSGVRDTPTGKMLYLARPISAAPACLECHSTAKMAPAAMIKQYGAANGFGWKQGEIIGAQIVSVPMALPVDRANEAFKRLMGSLVIVAAVTLLILNLALTWTVIRPVARFAQTADEISKGNLDVPELPVKGKDEISTLAEAFNRMHRSLVKAMRMLEN